MVSVIIPLHNLGSKGDYCLKKTLDSILAQTYSDYEVLLMENGSTDDTIDIAKEYCQKDSRFKLHILDTLGVSNARNKGIELATGDYISFVDGDDFISNDYLYSACSFLDSNKDVDFCVLSSEFYYVKSNKYKELYTYDNTEIFYKPKENNSSISTYIWGKVYRKDFIAGKFFFNISISSGEDTIFMLDVFFSCNKYAVVNKGTYYYTQNRKNQATSVMQIQKEYNTLEEYRLKQEILQKHGLIDKIGDVNYILIQLFMGANFASTAVNKASLKDIKDIINHFQNEINTIDVNKYNGCSWQKKWFKRFQNSIKFFGLLGGAVFLKYMRIYRNLFVQPFRIKWYK